MRNWFVVMIAIIAAGCGTVPDEKPWSEPLPAVIGPTMLSAKPVKPIVLRLPGMKALVIPLSMEGSTLTPPDDPTVLGWWGRLAGARQGVTLLTGHTVSTGGGVFDDLEQIPVGTSGILSGVRYRVTSVEVITKSELARRAQALFSQTGPHRLVLVTCEGYNPATGEYDENVVVTLRPV